MDNWTEFYNCHKLVIARTMTICVNWETGGFRVSFEGRKLKEPIRDLAQAKAAGIRLARKVANEILTELTEEANG